jgi:hypothetical protein
MVVRRRRGKGARGSLCCHHGSAGNTRAPRKIAAAITTARIGIVVDGLRDG